MSPSDWFGLGLIATEYFVHVSSAPGAFPRLKRNCNYTDGKLFVFILASTKYNARFLSFFQESFRYLSFFFFSLLAKAVVTVS